jgi:hypothetical protein
MKTVKILFTLLVLWLLTVNAYALSPARPRPLPEPPELPYTESEINTIANVVNGEVGGISGTVTIYYPDGAVVEADGQTLRRIHARVVDNQVRHELFPDTVRRCVALYWTPSYAATSWRTSEQWQRCRTDTLMALYGLIDVPDTVLAATCDPRFAERYDGYKLWAKVKWNTGWTHGTFYYYQYGG